MWMQMFPLSWSQFVARSQACLCIDLEDVVCFPALFCNRCAAPSVQMMRLMFFSWSLPAVWDRIGRALAFWSPLRFLSTQEAFVDFAQTGPTGLYWLIVCTPEGCTIRADLIHSTDSTWTWLNMPEASVAATICTFIARSKECQSKVQTCLGRWLPPKSAPCSDPIRRSGLVRRSWWVSWLRCCCSCLGWKLQGGRGVHDSPQNPQFFWRGRLFPVHRRSSHCRCTKVLLASDSWGCGIVWTFIEHQSWWPTDSHSKRLHTFGRQVLEIARCSFFTVPWQRDEAKNVQRSISDVRSKLIDWRWSTWWAVK